MGVAEEAAHQIANLGAGSLLASLDRLINVRTAILHVLHVAFFFQSADRGQDRVISQSKGKPIQHLLDRAATLTPEHIHDAKLGFCQGCGLLGRHSNSPYLVLRRAKPGKVTNYLVDGWGATSFLGSISKTPERRTSVRITAAKSDIQFLPERLENTCSQVLRPSHWGRRESQPS